MYHNNRPFQWCSSYMIHMSNIHLATGFCKNLHNSLQLKKPCKNIFHIHNNANDLYKSNMLRSRHWVKKNASVGYILCFCFFLPTTPVNICTIRENAYFSLATKIMDALIWPPYKLRTFSTSTICQKITLMLTLVYFLGQVRFFDQNGKKTCFENVDVCTIYLFLGIPMFSYSGFRAIAAEVTLAPQWRFYWTFSGIREMMFKLALDSTTVACLNNVHIVSCCIVPE